MTSKFGPKNTPPALATSGFSPRRQALTAWSAAVLLACMMQATLAAPRAGGARPTTVTILPLSPVDTGLPYAPLPTAAQLSALTRLLAAGVGTSAGVHVQNSANAARELRARGFDQSTTQRSCAEPKCAADVGRAVGADLVVYGGVTRLMAVIWSTEVSVVDVHSNAVLGPLDAGYKGDYSAMEVGEHRLGEAVRRLIARSGSRSSG
ncbi:MAG: hypothetical protein ACR2KS_07965 [Candidatus Eremiobacter antarcticus]|nr:DUF2380 domain-containing protein [Candidatus Eremiobacteraeota bacterium]